MFSELRCEVIVRRVDIGGVIEHNSLSVPFIVATFSTQAFYFVKKSFYLLTFFSIFVTDIRIVDFVS